MSENGKTKEREQQLYKSIRWDKIPRHIAIIMDGNGRWAEDRNLPRLEGHRKGADVLRDILTVCHDFKIEIFTVYAFSTENWKRPDWEVDFLMELPYRFLNQDIGLLMEKNIKFRVTGFRDKLPARAREAINNTLEKTGTNTGMIFNMAINYGGRSEIVWATQRIVDKVLAGDIVREEIDDLLLSQNLLTSDLPDPDLVIRTGGEIRISNFLLWQIAYSELYFSSVFWPDFSRVHLMEAIDEFQRRRRRFGGLEG